jgi:mono/diheme cytochrome c family protein
VERPPDAPVPVPEVVDETLQHGAMLYRAASCVGCHSPPFADAEHLGGGRDLPTIFGRFYAPNISPGPAGIGDWTEADFVRAMREGRSPEGRPYWPTFPYMTYTRMSDADLHALWVYLRAQPAVDTQPPPHEVRKA